MAGPRAALYLDVAGLDTSPGQRLLRQAGVEVLHAADTPSAEQRSHVVALLAGYGTVSEELLASLPGLRVVATHSAGVDMVDLDAVRRRGLLLANVPAGAVEEVAVHALALILAMVRGVPQLDARVRAGGWDVGVEPPPIPQEVTLGVMGLGRIGRRLTELARPLFGRVVGYDPAVPESGGPPGVDRVDFTELLAVSRCLSLHLPLSPETRQCIDADALGALPPGAVLVNVSRGELVDEAALLAALERGHLAGAALDVRTSEPPAAADVLLRRPDVLSTPHVAYLSPQALIRYAETPARNVLSLLTTGRLLDPVELRG